MRQRIDWTDAPECPNHESVGEGCPVCFRESVNGGFGTLMFHMPWIEIQAYSEPLPDQPLRVRGLVIFEGRRLFDVIYTPGEFFIPAHAQGVVEDLRLELEAEQDALYVELEEARDAGDGDREHRALQALGTLGGRLDRVRSWAVVA